MKSQVPPPCSQMWTKIVINSMVPSLKTCCKRKNVSVSLEEIDSLGAEVFNQHPIHVRDKKHFLEHSSMPQDCASCALVWPDRKNIIYNDWNDRQFSSLELRQLEKEDHIDQVELYLSKVCNQACLYCSHEHSSKWASLMGNIYPDDDVWQDAILNALYAYIEKRIKSGNQKPIQYRFGGGEPFLSRSLFPTINALLNQHQRVAPESKGSIGRNRISIISNLNFKASLLDPFFELVERYDNWEFAVAASVDAVGEIGEQIRVGLDFKTYAKNLERLAKCDRVFIEVLPSMSSLNITTFPEFLNWIFAFMSRNNVADRRWVIGFNIVHFPEAMFIGTLPDEYKAYIKKCRPIIKKWNRLNMDSFLDQLEAAIGTTRTAQHKAEVKKFFDHMCKVQQKDFYKAFPVIKEILRDEPYRKSRGWLQSSIAHLVRSI